MSLLLEDPLDTVGFEDFEADEREFGPMSADSSALAFDICAAIDNHSRPKRLGRARSEVKIKLPGTNLNKKPDGIYVAGEKWPVDRPIPRVNAWEILPDICLEVVSPTDTADDVQAKIGDYLEAGVGQVWVAYPEQRQIYVYESPKSVRLLIREDSLTGGDVIPGLELPLAELFPEYDAAD